MKKLTLAVTVLGLFAFTACKSEKEKVVDQVNGAQAAIQETTDEAVAKTQEAAKDISNVLGAVPTFTSPEAATIAGKYAEYVTELQAAAASGNQEKLNELTAKAVGFEKELQGITQKLTAEDAKKLTEYITQLQNTIK